METMSDSEEPELTIAEMRARRRNGRPIKSDVTEKATKSKAKGKPLELSSRRASRGTMPNPLKAKVEKVLDPRFMDLCGKFNQTGFQRSYGFLDEWRTQEKAELKDRIKKKKAREEEDEEAVATLRRLEDQDRQRQRLAETQEAKRALRKQEREAVRTTGKIPYYHKKSDIHRAVLAKKYEELKKSGKVEHAMAKRSKKLGSKEKKKMPMRRRGGDEA